MDVMSLRVSYTHVLRGSLSSRSEIYSMGEWLVWVVATGFMVVVCECCLGFAGFVCFSRCGLFGAYLDFGR
jgi:hypothetical protein